MDKNFILVNIIFYWLIKKYMYSSMIDNIDCYFIELCICMGSCLF